MSGAALRHLRQADTVLARVMARAGPYRLRPRAEGTHFDAVLGAVVSRQLSGQAATTIHGRLMERIGGPWASRGAPTPRSCCARAPTPSWPRASRNPGSASSWANPA